MRTNILESGGIVKRFVASGPTKPPAQTVAGASFVQIPTPTNATQAKAGGKNEFSDHELGEVVAALTGAWSCLECGYSLAGQEIHSEPKYGFLVCRCPECGRVWPIERQELSLESRRRAARVSAVLWWGMLVAGTLGTGMFLFGMAASAATWTRWGHDPGDWIAMSDMLWFPPATILIAIASAFGLPHVRTRGLMQLAGISMGIGAVSLVPFHLSEIGRDPPLHEVIASVIHLVAGCVSLALSVLVARPMARGIALRFMNQKLRIAATGLWTADGRTPPWVKST